MVNVAFHASAASPAIPSPFRSGHRRQQDLAAVHRRADLVRDLQPEVRIDAAGEGAALQLEGTFVGARSRPDGRRVGLLPARAHAVPPARQRSSHGARAINGDYVKCVRPAIPPASSMPIAIVVVAIVTLAGLPGCLLGQVNRAPARDLPGGRKPGVGRALALALALANVCKPGHHLRRRVT